MSQTWTQSEGIAVAKVVESFCPAYGCHVALTGGLLYKEGPRKDLDLLFYCIRQRDEIDRDGLLARLVSEGFMLGKQFGWVQKAAYEGKDVDLFFPEAFPATSRSQQEGAY